MLNWAIDPKGLKNMVYFFLAYTVSSGLPNIYENNDQFDIGVFLWSVGTPNQFSFFQKAKFKQAFV